MLIGLSVLFSELCGLGFVLLGVAVGDMNFFSGVEARESEVILVGRDSFATGRDLVIRERSCFNFASFL